METQPDPSRETNPATAPEPVPPAGYKTRQEVPLPYRWRLEDIFPDQDTWEAALSGIAEKTAALRQVRGTLHESAARLAAAVREMSELECDLSELVTYARMHRDQDNSHTISQAMTDRVMGLYFKVSEETAFLIPELAQIDQDILLRWLQEEPALADYRQMILDQIRNRAHILSEAEEALLSKFGPVSQGISDTYLVLETVDLDLGTIVDTQGETIKMSNGRFAQLREHPARPVRAEAFRQMHESYGHLGQTLAGLLGTQIKSDLLYASARKYDSALEAALFADNLPVAMVDGLIEAIHDGQPVMNRYLSMRQQQLGLPDLHIYDTYLPIVKQPERKFTFAQAADLVRAALKPLGSDYLAVIEQHLTDRWIDVYETPGKSTGAYSWGTYRSHPYILLNFSGTLSDVFTLAHELGHSLHTWYSNKRPFVQSGYPIFLAEIASTVNENLLMRYLLGLCDIKTAAGRQEKAWLLNHFMEEFRLTAFRQTMFAEFEKITHARAEAGDSLTAEALCHIYQDLLRQYFGPDVVIDDYMKWEWSRIPHFYTAFYVYKYATGFSAAIALGQQIAAGDPEAVARYLEFLGSGGSDYPLALLQKAGVDLGTAGPVRQAVAVFAQTLSEYIGLLQA